MQEKQLQIIYILLYIGLLSLRAEWSLPRVQSATE